MSRPASVLPRVANGLHGPALARRDVLERAHDEPEPLVREHAAWARTRIRDGCAVAR